VLGRLSKVEVLKWISCFSIKLESIHKLIRMLHLPVSAMMRVCHYALVPSLLPSSVQEGSMALSDAAANGHADCVRLLLESGADKETKSVRDLLLRITFMNACLPSAQNVAPDAVERGYRQHRMETQC
jgi:hypothetical protein